MAWQVPISSTGKTVPSPWSVGIESSPAYVDPSDAAKATVPIMMLASNGEPADKVEEFEKALTVPHVVETFATQKHGWMSVRGDMADPEIKKEYERGYQMAVDFLGKHM